MYVKVDAQQVLYPYPYILKPYSRTHKQNIQTEFEGCLETVNRALHITLQFL